MSAPLVIVSGGAESVAATVVEWAIAEGHPFIVFALSSPSILEGAMESESMHHAGSMCEESQMAALASLILDLHEKWNMPVIVFPTEDDSLYLTNRVSDRLGNHVVMHSACRAVAGGGLAKDLLFETLAAAGLADDLPETIIVENESEVESALMALRGDVVLKPSSKPFGRMLQTGAKIHSGTEIFQRYAVEERMHDFSSQRRWLVQRKLRPLDGGERSACIVRDRFGNVRYAEVVEWLKYPARGGSACIVETQPDSTALLESVRRIAAAVDLVGVAELSYLADESGRPQLLELNARPWLQIELLQKAGFNILSDVVSALQGRALEDGSVPIERRVWMSIERLLLRFATRDGGGFSETLRVASARAARRCIFPVWSSSVTGLKRRWIARLVRRLFR